MNLFNITSDCTKGNIHKITNIREDLIKSNISPLNTLIDAANNAKTTPHRTKNLYTKEKRRILFFLSLNDLLCYF